MKTILLIGLSLIFSACASVKSNNLKLEENKYMITCNGNGYARESDTFKCLQEESEKLCAAQGKKYKLSNPQTGSNLGLATNTYTGQITSFSRPHVSAIAECY